MAQWKYIAAGFVSDAEKLLEDFIRQNSTDFSVFAKTWRKYNFSFIYMGRGTERDLNEFTQEIFYLSTRFLSSTSVMYQVGGIYLLYALFRNQILVPPVRIRLIFSQWQSIKAVLDSYPADKHPSLHYVTIYLVENAFDYVGCSSLMGPGLNNLAESRKNYETGYTCKSLFVVKAGLNQIAESNILKDIDKLCLEYTEAKKALKIPPISYDRGFGDFDKRLEELMGRQNDLENMFSSNPPVEESRAVSSRLGLHRTRLKKSAFSKTSGPYRESRCVVSDHRSGNSTADEPATDDPTQVEQDLTTQKSTCKKNGFRSRRVRKKRQRQTATRHYYKEPGKDCDDLRMVADCKSLRSPSQRGDWLDFSDSEDEISKVRNELYGELGEEPILKSQVVNYSSEIDDVPTLCRQSENTCNMPEDLEVIRLPESIELIELSF